MNKKLNKKILEAINIGIQKGLAKSTFDEELNEGKFSRLMGGAALGASLLFTTPSCTNVNEPELNLTRYEYVEGIKVDVGACKNKHTDWQSVPENYGYVCYVFAGNSCVGNKGEICLLMKDGSLKYYKNISEGQIYYIRLESEKYELPVCIDWITSPVSEWSSYYNTNHSSQTSQDNGYDEYGNCKYQNATKFFYTVDWDGLEAGEGIVYQKWMRGESRTDLHYYVAIMVLKSNLHSYTIVNFEVDKSLYDQLEEKQTFVDVRSGKVEIIENIF